LSFERRNEPAGKDVDHPVNSVQQGTSPSVEYIVVLLRDGFELVDITFGLVGSLKKLCAKLPVLRADFQ